MFSRTFEYKGYDGNMHKDTYWFNLDEAELTKMELSRVGGIRGFMTRLMKENRPAEIVDMFEKIILGSVGERTADGRRFVKNQEIIDDFRFTPAYSQLFMELVSSSEKLSEFFRGCIPEEVAAKITEKEQALAEAGLTTEDLINGNEEAEKILRSDTAASVDGKPSLSVVKE